MKMLIKVDFGNLQNPILDENGVPDLALYDYIYGEIEMGTLLNGSSAYVVKSPFGFVRIPSGDVRVEIEALPEHAELIQTRIDEGKVWVI